MNDTELDTLLMTGGGSDPAHPTSLDPASLDLAGADLALADAIIGRARRRRHGALLALAGAVAVGGTLLVPRGHADSGAVWAATPEALTAEMSSAIDTACRGVSASELPAPSTVDVRGTGGVALYDLDAVWLLCTFVSDDGGAADARLTAAPVPDVWDGPVGPDISGRISEQLTNAELGGEAVFVVTGICWDGCPGDVFRFETERGAATAVANADGEYAAWLPAGSTFTGIYNGTPP